MNNSKYLLINSQLRSSGNTSNYNININDSIQSFRTCKICALNIPISIYNITTLNNHLIMVDSLNNEYNIFIDPGNYSMDNLIIELQNKINNTFIENIIITYNETTFKLTFTTLINTFYFKWFTTNNSLNKVLGYDNINTTLSLSTTSTYVADLSLPGGFIISINKFPNNVVTTNGISGTFYISINQNGSYINYHYDSSQFRNESNYNITNLQNMNVKLINVLDGSILDINNAEWSFLLEFQY